MDQQKPTHLMPKSKGQKQNDIYCCLFTRNCCFEYAFPHNNVVQIPCYNKLKLERGA